MLTLLDTLLHEYGWLLEYALWQVPLPTCLALYAAIDARYGGDPKGPTFAELEMIAAMNAATPKS